MQVIHKDFTTSLEAQFLIQTNDEPPAMLVCKYHGWWTGPRDTMEKICASPEEADIVAASQYRFRANVELETGDERYSFLSHSMWLASGCRRMHEIILDAYKVS